MKKKKPNWKKEAKLWLASLRNIISDIDVTSEIVQSGLSWYQSARDFIQEVSELTGKPVDIVAGIVAGISPRLSWGLNKKIALRFLTTPTDTWTGCLKHSVNRAKKIMSGELSGFNFKGPKIKAFFHNLMGDESVYCIDGWMLKACGSHRQSAQGKCYALVCEVMDTVRKEFIETTKLNVTQAQFQAIVWCLIRGRSN